MQKSVASLMTALIGLILFAAFIAQDIQMLPEAEDRQLPWGLILRYGVAMTLGGGLAGYLFRGLFGRKGVIGWLLALIGGLIAAIFAGILGSAIGDLPEIISDGFSMSDVVRIAAGALILPLSVSAQPFLLAVFIGLVVITHLWCRRLRMT